MKRVLFGTFALAAFLAGPAMAADLPVKAPAYARPPPPAISWTGWYVGLNAGGGWGTNSGIDNAVASWYCVISGGCTGLVGSDPGYGLGTARAVPLSFDSKLNGFLGGAQIGYNYQTGHTILGIEADFQGAGIKGSASASNTVLVRSDVGNEFVTVAGTGSQKIDFLGTLRGRLGWTPNDGPSLLYMTGGLAYGHTETSVSFIEQASVDSGFNASSAASTKAWRAGWTVGGGFEWMFAPHWSVKGEYLYYDIGSVTVNNAINAFSGSAPFFGVGIASEAHYRGSIARAGVNYHF